MFCQAHSTHGLTVFEHFNTAAVALAGVQALLAWLPILNAVDCIWLQV
jgi:hypothetical protein